MTKLQVCDSVTQRYRNSNTPHDILGETFKLKPQIMTPTALPYRPHSGRPYFCPALYESTWNNTWHPTGFRTGRTVTKFKLHIPRLSLWGLVLFSFFLVLCSFEIDSTHVTRLCHLTGTKNRRPLRKWQKTGAGRGLWLNGSEWGPSSPAGAVLGSPKPASHRALE